MAGLDRRARRLAGRGRDLLRRTTARVGEHGAPARGGGRSPEHAELGPVSDWRADFDHTDEAWAADPFAIWDELRRHPMAHTTRFGGAWLPTRHADVAAIANDTDHFSSRSVVITPHRPPLAMAPEGVAPPVTSDPPVHAAARRLLLPAFSAERVDALVPSTRAHCRALLRAADGRDVIDAATEYAQHIPVQVIADMLGLPEADGDRFRGFVHEIVEGVTEPFHDRIGALGELFAYLEPHIEARAAEPGPDLISLLLDAELHGAPLTPAGTVAVARTVALILLAGIDTTWSAIGASIWHLAAHPADRERLQREPALLPTAIEELLRAYAPVSMGRLVKEDVELGGCPMEAEEWVLLCFPAANRDPAAFDRPDEVLIDRQPNRHVAFGLGIHRCLGSHLARMELRVALEEWLRAHPTFELHDPSAVRWSTGQVRGPRRLPIRVGGSSATA